MVKYLPTANDAEVNVMNVDACYQEQHSFKQQSSRRKTKNNNQKRDSFESLPLFIELKQLKIPKHFLDYIRENTTLEENSISSAGSGLCTEEWVRRLLTTSDEHDHILFDIVCQSIVSKVIYFIRETCVASD